MTARATGNGPLSITVEDPACEECLALQQAMWAELGALYGKDTGPTQWAAADLAGPGTAFVAAWRDGRAVGCGAVVPLEGSTGELKRMYVVAEERRRGVAARLMAALEALALGLGYDRLRLETGVRQPAALALYRGFGYARADCWGRYAEDPESVCLEKSLARGNGAGLRGGIAWTRAVHSRSGGTGPADR